MTSEVGIAWTPWVGTVLVALSVLCAVLSCLVPRHPRSRGNADAWRPKGHAGNSGPGRHGCIDRGTGATSAGNRETTGRPPHREPGPSIPVRPPRTGTKTYFCRRKFHD